MVCSTSFSLFSFKSSLVIGEAGYPLIEGCKQECAIVCIFTLIRQGPYVDTYTDTDTPPETSD